MVKSNESCNGCNEAKQTRLTFPQQARSGAREPLERVFADVCGPVDVPSLGGGRYFLTIDDFSRFLFVCCLKKSGVFEKFKQFLRFSEKSTGKQMKNLRTDLGGEFESNEFLAFFKSKGIARERTIAGSSQQNGVAERCNRTMDDIGTAMLKHANLPTHFWAETVAAAAYVRNRSATSRPNDGKSPSLSTLVR